MDSIKTPKDNIILVPTDFSTAANNALEHALQIATLFDNEITLLHVLEDHFFTHLFSAGMDKTVMREKVDIHLEKIADVMRGKHSGLKVNTMIREGRTDRQIIDVSKSLACDSVVMGFNGLTGIDHFMGSTTLRVLKSATHPVVIIKDIQSSTNYKKIVLPIDLTRESRQKVSWAVHLAHKYDSEIHVIMEVEDDEFLRKRVRASMNQVEHILAKKKVRYISKILDDQNYPDHFGKDIIQYSEEVQADLVMIMTQKEGGLLDFFVGSFAQQIIDGTKRIPIMAINPKEVVKSYWATETF